MRPRLNKAVEAPAKPRFCAYCGVDFAVPDTDACRAHQHLARPQPR